MIKYAVMTFMYARWADGDGGSHEELIQIVGDAGAEGIEAFANHFFGKEELLELYRKEMASRNLTMPVMDLLANLASFERKQREEAYETMRRGIDVCDAFDTEIVHLAGCKLSEGQTPEDGRKRVVEGIMDFVDDVEARGMTLAFENFPGTPKLMVSAADCLDILDRTGGRAKFVFDTGNFVMVGERAEDNFARLIDRTCHFHFKDFKPEGDPTALCGTHFGQGRIKNRDIARAIRRSGYNGWVALESYLQGDNGPRETVAKELAVLKAMFSPEVEASR